jgi:outer membrane lipopolysaccharide assembly protein LptE/RlpB
MKIKINLLKVVLLLAVIVLTACTFAFAQTETAPAAQITLESFLSDNWSYIALVLSEAAAFLPSKFAGIFRMILTLAGTLLTKKK